MNETPENNQSSMMYCKHCGKRIPADSDFCPDCGGNLQNTPSATPNNAPPKKKNGCATVLLIFLVLSFVGFIGELTGGDSDSSGDKSAEANTIDLSGTTLQEAADLICAHFDDTTCDVSTEDCMLYFTVRYEELIGNSTTAHMVKSRVLWILKQLAPRDGDIKNVFFLIKGPAVGGGETTLLYVRIKGDTLRSLDFTNVYANQILDLVDEYNLHPDLR